MTGPARPFSELRSSGMLWLINRVVFHPRGYALALHLDDDGQAIGWSLEGDGSEAWAFPPEIDDECFSQARATFASPRPEEADVGQPWGPPEGLGLRLERGGTRVYSYGWLVPGQADRVWATPTHVYRMRLDNRTDLVPPTPPGYRDE